MQENWYERLDGNTPILCHIGNKMSSVRKIVAIVDFDRLRNGWWFISADDNCYSTAEPLSEQEILEYLSNAKKLGIL